MGNYNPDAPNIIGQEWVPIRQANYLPDSITERGYTFRIDHSTPIVSGAFYVKETPISQSAAHVINVYPEGTEDLTGPIKQLDIPAGSFAVTGAGANCSFGTNCMSVFGDGNSMVFLGGNSPAVGVSFEVGNYSQQLFGKRILDVSFVYQADGTLEALDRANFQLARQSDLANTYGVLFGLRKTTPGATLSTADTVSISDMNPFWQSGTTPYTPTIQKRIYPWRYPELALFGASAGAQRLILEIQCSLTSFPNDFLSISYLGMRVTYCEEKRVMYGGYFVNGNSTTDDQYYPDSGPAFIQLTTPSFTSPGNTAAGRYTVTQTTRDVSFLTVPTVPTLHAVRELYPLTPQRGVLVNYGNLAVNTEFVSENTDVLPQITLHTAAAIVTGVHPYGTSVGVPIYGSVTAIQEIDDNPVGTSKQYPQVRFYARRFGDTTEPLRLIDVATGTFTVSISVADFDALPEIVDGWREVNLRFASPPSFATAAGAPDWRWDAVGETASNQWQVLAADGPSFTGAHGIGTATYYAPQGDTVTLTWQSPAISGTANDTTSDAVLIFSTDPPTVSGFAISVASQAVTGVALDCGTPPGCVPTGIGYHHLTWSPVAVTGSIEIQRSDTVNDWATILLTTDTTRTSFDDYEARVGTLSSYRIRTLNVLDFAGAWATVTSTLTGPGVSVGGDANSILIFTSNESPTSNLAYTMVWESRPVEEFIFPEADRVIFQRMYGRNFPVAFHPLEREGEQFTRAIVVNAAAIPIPSLGNFRELRDLAWADLPYVCVRDELGNRWYANVRVPSGAVQADRTIYIAQIQVAEVSETPCAVT